MWDFANVENADNQHKTQIMMWVLLQTRAGTKILRPCSPMLLSTNVASNCTLQPLGPL